MDDSVLLEGQRIKKVEATLISVEANTRHRLFSLVLTTVNGEVFQIDDEIAERVETAPQLEPMPLQDLSGLGTPVGERVEAVFTRVSAPPSVGIPALPNQLFMVLESGRIMGLVRLGGGGSKLHIESLAETPLIRKTDKLISPLGSDLSDEIGSSRR